MRVLLAGWSWRPSIEYCWAAWLRDNDLLCAHVDPYTVLAGWQRTGYGRRLTWRFLNDWWRRRAAEQLRAAIRQHRPTVVLAVASHVLSRDLIEECRSEWGGFYVHFFNEDIENTANTSPTLLEAVPAYDLFVTTKNHNIDSLEARGARHVLRVAHGYRPGCHYPISVDAATAAHYGSPVSFVGTWELERSASLASVADLGLRIWGTGWSRVRRSSPVRECIEDRAVYCEDFARVAAATDVNLAFLRKQNRDQHTSRTFEIPACGGFQLSERTDEVRSFFAEGREIECFSSDDELRDKTRFYLANVESRRRIAQAGYERTIASNYSFLDRLEEVLARVALLTGEAFPPRGAAKGDRFSA